MNHPFFSVIIPTFNRATLLPHAIQSVLDQTFSDYEIIIIDDGSKDNTREIVKSIFDQRIRYFYQENKGISAALNAGIMAAHGKIISRLDSDDIWHPTLLETEAAIFANDLQVGLVYSKAQAMDLHGRAKPQISGAPEKFPGDTLKSILCGDFICAITTSVRKECYEQVSPFDETLKGNEDWDMWIRLARVTKFFFIDQVLANFRMHAQRTTGSQSAVFYEIVESRLSPLDKFFNQTNLLQNIISIKGLAYRNAYIDVGLKYLSIGNKSLAMRNFKCAIEISEAPVITSLRIIYLFIFYKYLSKRTWGVRLVEKIVRHRRDDDRAKIYIYNSINKPKLAIISIDIRRDLIKPLRIFSRLNIIHFYKIAPYDDLSPEDWDETLIKYNNFRHLLHLLRKEKPDIIQTVEILSLKQWLIQWIIFLYARTHNIPLFAGVHISRPLKEKYGLILSHLLKLAIYPTTRYSSIFFYLSDGAKNNLRWLGVPEQKLVRHMYGTWGVDPEEFTPQRNGREPNWGDEPVLLFVGRIHAEKGILDLLEAYKIVSSKIPNVQLVIIGNGPQMDQVKLTIRENQWQDRVLTLGTIKNQDLPPYFRAATIFVSPSVTTRKWEEYVGVTNLQAMASGKAIISTRSGAIPEYVPEGAGILVPENNPQALAKAICDLLSNQELRQQMGQFGREYTLYKYDAARNAKLAENIIIEKCFLPDSN